MFIKFKNTWENWGFEIILGVCVGFILIYSLYRMISGSKGSWSKSYYLPNKKNSQSFARSPPPPPKDSKGEIECRSALYKLTGKTFPKSRPDFLRNPVTGGIHNLELDCFNPELNLAVEYSGQQHYKFIPYFHKNKEAFLNQKYRDDMKKRICRDYGINLIEVPYTVKIHEIEPYLKRELRNLKYIKKNEIY